jgi:hypothetical protein
MCNFSFRVIQYRRVSWFSVNINLHYEPIQSFTKTVLKGKRISERFRNKTNVLCLNEETSADLNGLR